MLLLFLPYPVNGLKTKKQVRIKSYFPPEPMNAVNQVKFLVPIDFLSVIKYLPALSSFQFWENIESIHSYKMLLME